MPSRQSWSNAIGSPPSAVSRSLMTSNISRNDISGLMSGASMSSNAPAAVGLFWRQTRSLRSIASVLCASVRGLLVVPLGEVDVLELELLLVQLGLGVHAGVLPRRDVREGVVVAQRLALFRLVLGAEVTPARLLTGEGIEAEQFTELQEVGDASGLLQRLVDRLVLAEDAHVPVELLAE